MIPTLQQQPLGAIGEPAHLVPEDLTTEFRKNKFFTVAPDKQEKSPIPFDNDFCEPVKSMLRLLMEKFCPSKLPWKELEEDPFPNGTKFCTLEQSFLLLFWRFGKKFKKQKQMFYNVIREYVIDCVVIQNNILQIIASRDGTRRCLGAWLCFCKRECKNQREQHNDLCERHSLIRLFF